MLKLEYQYFEGCPNHIQMENNLKEALKGLESHVQINYILVETLEIAKETAFRGSPTLLIDGVDVEDMPAPATPSLSCRYYPNGVPSVQAIRKKIEGRLRREE